MERSQQSLAFEEYWRSLRSGRAMPSLDDFDPLQISDLIPNLFELFVTRGETISASIRFAGGDVRNSANTEVTDTDFLSYVPPDRVDATVGRNMASYDQPCGLCQVNPMSLDAGSSVFLELTGFPMLSSDHDAVLFGTVVSLKKDDMSDRTAIQRLERAQDMVWIDTDRGIPTSDFGCSRSLR